MPPANSDVDFILDIMVTQTETDGTSFSRHAVLPVHIAAVADVPLVFATDASGAKNTLVPITINGFLTDTDGSETLTYVIEGIPDGFALNKGHNNGDNSWTLTPAQLAGLALVSPYNFEGRVHLRAYAVAHENDGSVARSLPDDFSVAVGNPLILEINLGAGIGVGGIGIGTGVGIGVNLGSLLSPDGIVLNEDSVLLLNDAASLLNGLSGLALSLLADIRITTSVPGASLSAGTNLGNGVWSLVPWQLNNLYLIVPPNSDQDFTITVQARLLTAVTLTLFTTLVHVIGVADVPSLSVMNATGIEDGGAIPINIAAALLDNDGSETLSITIKDLPPGFRPNLGIDNGDGSWSIPLAQLNAVAIIPAPNYSGDATYTVVAVATEREGDTSIRVVTGHIHVESVADAPLIAASMLTGTEDQPLALALGIGLVDSSEQMGDVVISGLPPDSQLSHATDNQDGTWTIHAADLGVVQLLPPENWSGDAILTVTASSVESNGTSASTIKTIALHIEAAADTPTIAASNEMAGMNNAAFLHISAALADMDGSEQLSIVISGMPEGSIFSAGLHNGDGSWTLDASDLNGLAFTPPENLRAISP